MSKKSPKIFNETLEANKTVNRWKLYDKYKMYSTLDRDAFNIK